MSKTNGKKPAAAKKKATKKAKKKTTKKASASGVEDADAAAGGTQTVKKTAKKGKKAKKSLVIVESPAKARTINKYLGTSFVVKASMGHIRDLPKGKFGIDIENGFQPEYTTIRGKGKVITELKTIARSARVRSTWPPIWTARGRPSPGTCSESLEVPEDRVFRVVFNEITKKAILEAFETPGRLDTGQGRGPAGAARAGPDHGLQAVSPLLWKQDRQGPLGREGCSPWPSA